MDVATTTVGLTDLKFRLVRDDFADAVAWVARTLQTRPTVPVLAGVLLTGSDNGLTISGFDYEVSAEVRLPAEIASPGTALVSGRLLSDITRVLADEKVNILSASVTTSGDRVAISRFTFEMGDPKHLGHLLNVVRNVEGVYDVYRVTSAA